MSLTIVPAFVSLALCAGMVVGLELGRRYGERRRSQDFDSTSTGVLDGAVLALLGLLIAFTFSSAANRFDFRRQLAVQESNDIGTAWLRLDVLQPEARAELQQLFREYVDGRLETYRLLPDVEAANGAYARTCDLQGRIWTRANAAAAQAAPSAPLLLLPALNSMFDTASARRAALLTHQPTLIFIMLGTLALCASVLIGHALALGGHGRWLHTLAFALITSLTVYVIMDLEFPSVGLIKLDLANQLLADVRAGMK